MKLKTILQIVIAVGLALVLVGNLFRIMHWPYSAYMLLSGYILISLSYPKMLLHKENRTYIDILKGLGILIWGAFNLIYFVYFPENRTLFNALSKIGLLIFIGAYIYGGLVSEKDEASTLNKIKNFLFIVGGTVVATGMFFKFMHWPGAGITLISGMFVCAGAFIITFFEVSEED